MADELRPARGPWWRVDHSAEIGIAEIKRGEEKLVFDPANVVLPRAGMLACIEDYATDRPTFILQDFAGTEHRFPMRVQRAES